MNYAEICIIKRDGKREDFSISKIKNAISKAFSASGIQDEQQLVADITMNVISQFATPTITVEETVVCRPGRKVVDESAAGSSEEIHHLSRMAEYGA